MCPLNSAEDWNLSHHLRASVAQTMAGWAPISLHTLTHRHSWGSSLSLPLIQTEPWYSLQGQLLGVADTDSLKNWSETGQLMLLVLA